MAALPSNPAYQAPLEAAEGQRKWLLADPEVARLEAAAKAGSKGRQISREQ